MLLFPSHDPRKMIISIDTETYEFNEKEGEFKPVLNSRKFILGCAIVNNNKEYYFYTHTEMAKWLKEQIEQSKHKVYIYGHNIEYDFYAIFKDELINDDMKYIMFGNMIAIYKNKGYFIDTMHFYKCSLKAVGETIGLEKLEMPETIRYIEELKPYLYRDTKIVSEAIVQLRKIMEQLGFRPRKLLTAGQLAITSFLTFSKRNNTLRYFTVRS